ncbi:hypothetical protein [Catenovulum maritimum]|uniref:hypothetical protein n=1 Tax=Catenovulum maritimum TaxID=1513271 RepID=UPI0006612DDB|nr:hypothetical protein [Catenovulum maritimum]
MKMIVNLLILLGLSIPAYAEADKPFPEIRYISNLDDEASFDVLKEHKAFDNLSKDLPGCPISLVVSFETMSTAGGAAASFTSIMLSAGTLGVVPVVSNNDVVIKYKLRVHGNLITEYSYVNNFTDAQFLYAIEHGLSKEAKVWAGSTVENFLADFSKDEKVKTLLEEYDYYFAEAADKS